MTKKDIIAELTNKGIQFNPNDKIADLEKLLGNVPSVPEGVPMGNKFVLLKTRAFIDEKTRVSPGVYVVSEVPERLTKLPFADCEIYDVNDVPVEAINRAAKTAGINYSTMKTSEVEEKVFKTVARSEFLTTK